LRERERERRRRKEVIAEEEKLAALLFRVRLFDRERKDFKAF
jgi:hypothetical protein